MKLDLQALPCGHYAGRYNVFHAGLLGLGRRLQWVCGTCNATFLEVAG